MGGFFFDFLSLFWLGGGSYLDHELGIPAHLQPILTRDLQSADEAFNALLLMGRLGGEGVILPVFLLRIREESLLNDLGMIWDAQHSGDDHWCD